MKTEHAQATASGLKSHAVTAQPTMAAHHDSTPEPHPISSQEALGLTLCSLRTDNNSSVSSRGDRRWAGG